MGRRATKCGETKEEKKPEKDKNPGQNTDPGKNPGQNTEPGKNPGGDKNPGTDQKPGGDKNPGGEKKPEADKPAEKPGDKPADKPGENKNPAQNTDQGKNPETDTTPAKSTKIDLSKLESNIKNELSKLAKDGVSPEEVLDVLKNVKGLEKLTLLHFSTVEFKGNKLTVEAVEDSNLITGKYEFTA
ncbi:hypothetical protein [Mycoplasmopsis bovis]|uniref:hypothetical protein n=1 Tax=Mycoplasmopsis bovis TaxID=28903 RepID=UPI00244ED5AB|nr:hypothetical protein [Mycoplasmopsis bovis]